MFILNLMFYTSILTIPSILWSGAWMLYFLKRDAPVTTKNILITFGPSFAIILTMMFGIFAVAFGVA